MKIAKNMAVNKFHVGNESVPVLVADNALDDPNLLRDMAASVEYSGNSGFFPGVRALAPADYQRVLLSLIKDEGIGHFYEGERKLSLSMCHFSLVTKRPEELNMLQRIPHFDSLDSFGLASVHYLFLGKYGGTAFYRHRRTGYERIDEKRSKTYFQSLESENGGPNMPGAQYINGDTPLFEQIEKCGGMYNRIVIYPRNLLHSGCIEAGFIPDNNPRTGRLSINSFIDVSHHGC